MTTEPYDQQPRKQQQTFRMADVSHSQERSKYFLPNIWERGNERDTRYDASDDDDGGMPHATPMTDGGVNKYAPGTMGALQSEIGLKKDQDLVAKLYQQAAER